MTFDLLFVIQPINNRTMKFNIFTGETLFLTHFNNFNYSFSNLWHNKAQKMCAYVVVTG